MPPTVALVHGSEVMRDQFQRGFSRVGLRSVAAAATALGSREDVMAFLRRHGAQAVVYEVPPPSEPGWTLFQRVYCAAQTMGSPLVLTTPITVEPDRVTALQPADSLDARVAET